MVKRYTKHPSVTLIIKANSFSHTFYKQLQHLYIEPNSNLVQYYTQNSCIFEEFFIRTHPAINQTRICLPFKLFYAAAALNAKQTNTFLKNLPICLLQ